MSKFIVSILTAATLLNSVSATAAESTGKIKLLLIEGVSNHDWCHRLARVKETLAKDVLGSVTLVRTGRPLINDARVGEQVGLTWKWVKSRLSFLNASTVGVRMIGLPRQA